jgi:polyphenol oxidase
VTRNGLGEGGAPMEEVLLQGIPSLRLRHWGRAFPWLVHGITLRSSPHPGASEGGASREAPASGGSPGEWDFRLAEAPFQGASMSRWEHLRRNAGSEVVVVSRQVHGSEVGRVERNGCLGEGRAPGRSGGVLQLAPDRDGHATDEPGVLLAVTVADCVPVFLVSERPRAVALLHAGWRGVEAGILEVGIASLEAHFGASPQELHLHLGPAIGGDVYEVGPEVFEALGLPHDGESAPLDVRWALTERALAAGVSPQRISRSPRCTLRDPLLYSHRGGDAGRQVAFLGIRTEG